MYILEPIRSDWGAYVTPVCMLYRYHSLCEICEYSYEVVFGIVRMFNIFNQDEVVGEPDFRCKNDIIFEFPGLALQLHDLETWLIEHKDEDIENEDLVHPNHFIRAEAKRRYENE